MSIVLFFIITSILLLIAVEDFRSRTVRIIWFPIILFLSVVYSSQALKGFEIVFNVLVIVCFLIIQVILLMLYFAIKHKRWINITNEYLGWGDILFLFVIVPFFSPLVYLMFYLSSLILTMAFVSIHRLINTNKMEHIPLAGIQSILLLLVLAYHQFILPVLFKDFLLALSM